MKYNIETATIENLNELYSLQLEYEHLLLSKELLKADLINSNSIYLIAKNEANEIVGCVGVNILVDHADIIMIVTKKDYVNNGIATLLLNAIISKCKTLNLESIFLEVRETNLIAISLYEKLNFVKIATRKKYYLDNQENALVYTYKI